MDDWHWYMDHEPFGFPVLDMWHGIRCATGIAPYLKSGAKAEPHHFMLRPPVPREMTEAETIALFKAALGGSKE